MNKSGNLNTVPLQWVDTSSIAIDCGAVQNIRVPSINEITYTDVELDLVCNNVPHVNVDMVSKCSTCNPGSESNLQKGSSSFEIPSAESPESMLTPEMEYDLSYNSPSNPTNDLGLAIRQNIEVNFPFITGDTLQDYMDDRLIRYNPDESQHNTRILFNGNHPFNANDFGRTPPASNSARFFLFRWFGDNKKVKDEVTQNDDIEKQLRDYQQYISSNKQSSLYIANEEHYQTCQELNNILNNVHFQANSSNSLLPRVKSKELNYSTLKTKTNAAPISPAPTNNELPISYTPKAFPISEFEFKYYNRTGDEEINGTGNIFDSMGNDMLDIINGSENFLTNCFQGIIKLFR